MSRISTCRRDRWKLHHSVISTGTMTEHRVQNTKLQSATTEDEEEELLLPSVPAIPRPARSSQPNPSRRQPGEAGNGCLGPAANEQLRETSSNPSLSTSVPSGPAPSRGMPLLASYQGFCLRLAQGRPPPGTEPPGTAAPTRAPRLPSGPSVGEAQPRAAPPQAETMRWGPPPPPSDLPRPVPASLGCWRPLLAAAAPRGRGRGRGHTGPRGSAPRRRPPGMRGVQEAEAAVPRQRAPPGSGAWPPPALSRLSRLVERGGACRKCPPPPTLVRPSLSFIPLFAVFVPSLPHP